jgi:hypothetical protein
MSYLRDKIIALRKEYSEDDKASIIESKGGRCELCGRKEGDKYIFGPTHYIKKHVILRVHIHIHKLIDGAGNMQKVCICCGCHASYHLFNRLDNDAVFGDRKVHGNEYVVAEKKRISARVRYKARKKVKRK